MQDFAKAVCQMTNEDWTGGTDAKSMLLRLSKEHTQYFLSQKPDLNRFLIACCRKNYRLMPESCLREAVDGVERWLVSDIDTEQLKLLHYRAEGHAYFLDYADKPEELAKIERLVALVPEFEGLPLEKAKAQLMRAAYFVDYTLSFVKASRVYDPKPLDAGFLCAALLREHLKPEF